MADALQILFEDNHCLAVVKPAALLTQGPTGIPTLEALVKAYLKEKYQKPGNVYLGVPHRLDRPVSGVVLFARNSKAADRLAEQFREHQVTKIYWGVVAGTLDRPKACGRIGCGKSRTKRGPRSAEPNAPGAKHAVLRYRVMQSLDAGTLVEFQPVTGRMHQIRVQAASRGHPLLGDACMARRATSGRRRSCRGIASSPCMRAV